MIFASEKQENLDILVKAVVNMKINDIRYELNSATTIDTQVEFGSNPDKITHTRNGINHQKLLSSWTIRIFREDISVMTPLVDPKIGANKQLALFTSMAFM